MEYDLPDTENSDFVRGAHPVEVLPIRPERHGMLRQSLVVFGHSERHQSVNVSSPA